MRPPTLPLSCDPRLAKWELLSPDGGRFANLDPRAGIFAKEPRVLLGLRAIIETGQASLSLMAFDRDNIDADEINLRVPDWAMFCPTAGVGAEAGDDGLLAAPFPFRVGIVFAWSSATFSRLTLIQAPTTVLVTAWALTAPWDPAMGLPDCFGEGLKR